MHAGIVKKKRANKRLWGDVGDSRREASKSNVEAQTRQVSMGVERKKKGGKVSGGKTKT